MLCFSLILVSSLEPRGGSQDALEPVLKGYYNLINKKTKPTSGRKKKGKSSDQNETKATESLENIRSKGAAFLAVCRGKVIHSCLLMNCLEFKKMEYFFTQSCGIWSFFSEHNRKV